MVPASPHSSHHGEELAELVREVEDYAIFLLSPEGRIGSWNLGASRIFGYDEGEIVGKHFRTFYGEEDLRAKKPEYELETATNEGRFEEEGWRIRKDGRQFWANTVITPLRYEDGTVRGFSKITRDLTARLESEERLRRSEEMLRLLVESVSDYAIFLLDTEGRIATWNKGAKRIKGYEPGEIIGRHFSTFYSDEDKAAGKPQQKLEIAIRDGSVEDEGWRIRKDGTRFWANVVITAVHDANGRLRGFAKVTRDITERKHAEETRQALFEQQEARRRAESSSLAAQEANRAKDAFLMTLSHELRTPMTAILGWARLLDVLTPGEPDFHQAIKAISSSAEVQAQLIDDLLDVSRITAGKLQLNVERADLSAILRAAVETVRSAAVAKSIRLEVEIGERLGRADVDPRRLQQVVWNLVSNGIKFTPPGGHVQIAAERSPSEVRISVRDNGEGFEPSFLPHLFEPFRQEEAPVTRHHGGLGLGLSIARHIVESHGGTLRAASAGRGKGAEFTITLPTPPSVDADETLRGRSVQGRSGPLAGIDVVIVEDDAGGREFLRVALGQGGATVRTADSVPAAMAFIDERRPDLIVTDIGLPGEDGFALVRRIRDNGEMRDVRIVIITAFAGERSKLDSANVDAFFTKPVDPFELVDRLGKLFSPPESL